MSLLKSRKLTISLFIVYLLIIASIILLKNKMSFGFLHMRFNFVSADVKRSVNLIPFGGMLRLNGKLAYNEVYLNALVFMPFGIFLGMLRERKSLANFILPITLTSLLFEVTQYAFALGASDITDIIANTLGGMIGVGIFFIFDQLSRDKARQVLNAIALILTIGFALLMCLVRPM